MATQPDSICGHDHRVEFYETDAFLVDTVCAFIVPALSAGEAAVVVATAAHRRAFLTALGDAGIDVERAVGEGRYVAADSAEVLSRFMVDGDPVASRFHEAIGAVMDRASHQGRQVRVYGEMVALLWDEGEADAACALEDLWNDLAEIRPFQLLCAYPMRLFDDASSAAFKRICEQHTTVIPSEGYSLLADPLERSRAVAQLQQETAALNADLRRLRAHEEVLAELAYVDWLTALSNRRAFDLHLEREWALSLRDGIDSFVLVADLDGFKALNDTFGHAAGDQVLRQFAQALRVAARGTDITARIGGDEFGILLIRCDERAALSFKARLREALAESSSPLVPEITASVGHASLRDSPSAAAALDRADLEMFRRKHATSAGRARSS